MPVKLVLAIPRTHNIFNWFKKKQIFLYHQDTLCLPEEVAGSAEIRQKEGLLVDSCRFQLWPCSIISKSSKLYTFWTEEERPCHLWIGGNMLPEDLCYGNEAVMYSLMHTLYTMFEMSHKEEPSFLGYLCSRHDTKQNAFGMLYHIKVSTAKMIENQYVAAKWMTVSDIKKIYRKLDPWSKRIFDYIYEHPTLRQQLGLYQKKF